MSILERFSVALAASAVELPGPELVPERLARAAAQVLPVDGAGLSLFFTSGRRLPLGASDDESAVAERLQFTVGEGPCLSAHAAGRPITADEATIRLRWPAFYEELSARTAIRGVISLPMEDEFRGFGAVDLYLAAPGDVRAVSLADALDVVAEVAAVFRATNRRASPRADGPAWLDAPSAERRSLVWQAMGFVNAGLGICSADALELLRAHAYGEGMDLDEVAARVVARELPLEELSLDSDAPHG